MTEWEQDNKIMLAVAAATMASEFDALKRIGDSTSKELWHGYVPQGDVVKAFWPPFMKAMESIAAEKNCRADIFYSAVDDRVDDADYIFATGIKVTLVTDATVKDIQQDNAKQLMG